LIEFSPRFTLNQLNAGATKFQSLYRGYITRKYTFLPSLILDRSVCDRLNAFLRLNRLISGACEVIEGKKYYIKWAKGEKVVTLLFPQETLIGSGFWKSFFSARTVKIFLGSPRKIVEQFESVWTVADDKTVDEVLVQKNLRDRFIQEKPPHVYFLEALEQIHGHLYMQRRLTNSFDDTQLNNPFQKSRYMRDLARNLAWMHKQGWMHGDVSLKNTLVEERIDDEGVNRPVLYLTDFGSSRTWGATEIRNLDAYVRWDPAKCFADINSPLVDWYGYSVTSIITWFPEMATSLKWEKFISTRQTIFENELRGNFDSEDSYWTDTRSFADLSPMEQKIWRLFVAICRKSSELYLHLKDRQGEITKAEIFRIMDLINSKEIERLCLLFANQMCEQACLRSAQNLH
jgi:serine/threonine protein kinase